MNQFQQFQNALILNSVKSNTYSLKMDSRYFVGKTPHGGYLNAIMHKALVSSLPHSTAISSSAQYLNRIDDKEILLEVEIFKIGKGSSSGSVKLIQDNNICAFLSGTCSDFKHMKGFDDLLTPPSEIFSSADKDSFVELNYDKTTKDLTPNFIKQLNVTVHPDHAWWDRKLSSEDAEARCSAYLEMDGGLPDQFSLSFYADILPPVVLNKYGLIGWIPTLTLTTHIRQMPTTNTLIADFKASDINKGYFEQDCNIWDLNKNLVASSRQLTRVLKSEEKLAKKN